MSEYLNFLHQGVTIYLLDHRNKLGLKIQKALDSHS